MENPLVKATKASVAITMTWEADEIDSFTNAAGDIFARVSKHGDAIATVKRGNKIKVIARRKTEKGLDEAVGRWLDKERERLGVEMLISVQEWK